MESPTTAAFLADFLKVRPYLLALTNTDEPEIAFDRRSVPLEKPFYTEELPNSSALLG